MSKITNGSLIRSGTGCFTAVPIRQQWASKGEERRTAKKALLEPASRVPYLILVCLTKSSADLMGVSMRSTVRNAARLAV